MKCCVIRTQKVDHETLCGRTESVYVAISKSSNSQCHWIIKTGSAHRPVESEASRLIQATRRDDICNGFDGGLAGCRSLGGTYGHAHKGLLPLLNVSHGGDGVEDEDYEEEGR